MSEFENKARRGRRGGLAGELWGFLMQSKKWWLIPIVLMLLLVSVLVVLSTTGAAPFIYTLF
ncbi:MAG: DUF5989 family protein [Acidobacteriota bacterium]|nr:DUF5989 family protein [Acidobacteriota bacterium]